MIPDAMTEKLRFKRTRGCSSGGGAVALFFSKLNKLKLAHDAVNVGIAAGGMLKLMSPSIA